MGQAVVVGTDGSPIGEALVRHGAVLAAASGGCVHIVASEVALGPAVRNVVERGVEVEAHVASGDLTAAVWEIADRVEADLIVIDRSTRNPLRRVLRSVYHQLVPNAWVPVDLIDLRAARDQVLALTRRALPRATSE